MWILQDEDPERHELLQKLKKVKFQLAAPEYAKGSKRQEKLQERSVLESQLARLNSQNSAVASS